VRGRNLAFVIGGLAVALLIVVALAPHASSDPDGLQRVAADEGFADQQKDAPFELLPGYSVPGVDHQTGSRILAGAIGTLAVAGLALGAGWGLRERARRRAHLDAAGHDSAGTPPAPEQA